MILALCCISSKHCVESLRRIITSKHCDTTTIRRHVLARDPSTLLYLVEALRRSIVSKHCVEALRRSIASQSHILNFQSSSSIAPQCRATTLSSISPNKIIQSNQHRDTAHHRYRNIHVEQHVVNSITAVSLIYSLNDDILLSTDQCYPIRDAENERYF